MAAEEHPSMIISTHHRYDAHQHGVLEEATSALPPAILGSPRWEQSMTNYIMDILEQLHDIHYYAHHHTKVASDRIKAQCDCLAKSQDSSKETESGFTALPRLERRYLSCKPP
jgi:hypothetical protein